MNKPFLLFCLLIFLQLLCLFLDCSTASAGQSPSITLQVDSLSGAATGSVSDPDRPGETIPIHFYIGGPYGTGTYIQTIYRTGSYIWHLPPQYRDGQTHTLCAYANDSIDGHGLTCISFSWKGYKPSIFLSVNSQTGVASGSVSDPDRPGETIPVHFYMDGEYGTGTYLGVTGCTGSYSWKLPIRYLDGQTHTLYAYAIDNISGHGLISNSFSWTGYTPSLSVSVDSRSGVVSGTATDQDRPGSSLRVNFHIGGSLIGYTTTSPSTGAYNWTEMPEAYKNGTAYTLRAVLIDPVSGDSSKSTAFTFIGYPPELTVSVDENDGVVSGTATDTDRPGEKIGLQFYIDNNEPEIALTELNGSYEWGIPSEYQDNLEHTLMVIAVDGVSGSISEVTSFNWSLPGESQEISISVSNISGFVKGSAFDGDRPDQSIEIEFYINDTKIGSSETNGSTGKFYYKLPASYQNGTTYTLYAYIIDDNAQKSKDASTTFTWSSGQEFGPGLHYEYDELGRVKKILRIPSVD